MKRRNKAFTLIELQVASVITLIVLTAVMALYLFSWRSFMIGNAILDVYSNSRNASGWFTRDIRCAWQVVPYYGVHTTTDNSMVLVVPSIDVNGNVIGFHFDYITYELRDSAQGKDLHRVVEKDALSGRVNEDRVIAHYCDSLAFSSFCEATGKMEKLSFYDGSASSRMLSTVNTVLIYLPINKSTISVSGTGAHTALINPTTVVRLRNK